jgi:opacity protein-like surface antigen
MVRVHGPTQALVALLMLISTRAAAQGMGPGGADNQTRAVQFGIGGGVVVPRTNARTQEVLNGATGQAYLLLRIAPGFPALRIGADYSRMKFGPTTTQSSSSAVGSARTQLAGIASLRFDLLPGPVRPYVLAGVGAFNVRDALLGGTSTLSTTEFGIDGGAGLSFRIGRISGFAETRLTNVYTKAQGLINTSSIQAFPITFGLIF